MTKEEFLQLTDELLAELDGLKEEIQGSITFEHGHKAAAKRARQAARRLKNELLQQWINASVEVTK